MGVRHIIESFDDVSRSPWRVVVAGGGAQSALWTQIVSDVTGIYQAVPAQTVGASYGDALLAAAATGLVARDADWTRIVASVEPRDEYLEFYSKV
jgi:xylulokinase